MSLDKACIDYLPRRITRDMASPAKANMKKARFASVTASVCFVAALFLTVTLPKPMGAKAASAGMPMLSHSTLCAPGMPSIDARSTCFPPSQATIAERQVPVPVVIPRGLVWRISGLALRELSIERAASGVVAINYLFGHLPLHATAPASLAIPRYAAPRPKYVLVREFVGYMKDAKLAVFRSGPASGGSAWHFVSNVAGRNLGLSITTNESKRIAERIGRALLRREAQMSNSAR